MRHKTLAIIMAAGYGTRAGVKEKEMLLDKEGRPFIDDALTFLRYESDTLDFSVLTRPEKQNLNRYLTEKGFQEHQVLYQMTGPKDHVLVFLSEYFTSLLSYRAMHRRFYRKTKQYDTIVLIPGDNKLTSEDLHLDDLLEKHENRKSDLTVVYSDIVDRETLEEGTAQEDLVVLKSNNRIQRIQRVTDGPCQEHIPGKRFTSPGIFAVRRGAVYNPITPLLGLFMWEERGKSLYFPQSLINVHAYFMRENWQGGRDTHRYIGS